MFDTLYFTLLLIGSIAANPFTGEEVGILVYVGEKSVVHISASVPLIFFFFKETHLPKKCHVISYFKNYCKDIFRCKIQDTF